MSQSPDTYVAPVPANVQSARHVNWRGLILGAALLLLWGMLCRALGVEWYVNEQYGYGWFVPFFAAYFFWLRWERRPAISPARAPAPLGGTVLLLIPLLLLLLPVRLFEVAAPDWRFPLWIHAGIATGLTLLLLQRMGGAQWVRHFAFPFGFFLVAVPWPLRFETPLTQTLMRVVASLSAEAITLCGIPARVQGNLIELNSGVVGVNEACSGVRSLQTSIMIGLLFGELKLLTPGRRLLLVGSAALCAFLGNFGRSLFLVWMNATGGPSEAARWHDIVGYAIVVLVFLGCLLTLKIIGRNAPARTSSPATADPSAKAPRLIVTSGIVAALCWLALVEAGVEGWYRGHETHTIPQPRWSVKWPEGSADFQRLEIDEEAQRQLRYDFGEEATWKDHSANDRYVGFFLRWNAGFSSMLRARAHRPDICLPGTGWQQTGDHGTRLYTVAPGLVLPFRHFTFERSISPTSAVFADAFFGIGEDRLRPADAATVRNAESHGPTDSSLDTAADFAVMVRAGIRNPGQQVLEIIRVRPQKVAPAQSEEDIARLLPQLVRVEKADSDR